MQRILVASVAWLIVDISAVQGTLKIIQFQYYLNVRVQLCSNFCAYLMLFEKAVILIL